MRGAARRVNVTRWLLFPLVAGDGSRSAETCAKHDKGSRAPGEGTNLALATG